MEIFDDSAWQMSSGEGAALEGILNRRAPGVAIAIGAPRAALALLADRGAEIHAFAAQGGQPADARGPATALDLGEPSELPAVLTELAAAGRNVDFVLIEAAGFCRGAVRDQLEILLDSPALANTVILVHPATPERVREEIDAVRFAAWPKVVSVEPDFLPGRLLAEEPGRHELRGGLALVLIDASARRYHAGPIVDVRAYPATGLLAEVRDYVIAREQAAGRGAAYAGVPLDPAQTRVIELLREELAHADHEIRRLRSVALHHEELWRSLMDSWSWRLTAPIRSVKRTARGSGGGGGG